MEISRSLPHPIPEHWDKLEKRLERLAKEFPLSDISFCAEQLMNKRADAKVLELLQPLLTEFPEIERIHVYHDSDPGYFHVYLEMKKGTKVGQKLQSMKRWITIESSSVEFRHVSDPISFSSSMKKFKLETRGSKFAKVIERPS